MSSPRQPQMAKLIVGILFRDFEVRRQVLTALSDRFGPWDFLSEPQPFTYTTYYDQEMGAGLLRQTGSLLELVQSEALPDIKLFTNQVEQKFCPGGNRQINLDPGLLTLERLVLATGKNFTHRIYLRDGIYADLTLIYQKGAYRPLPWTYPDYQEAGLLHFLSILRRKLIYQYDGRLSKKVHSIGGNS